jgi:hypothetical protein
MALNRSKIGYLRASIFPSHYLRSTDPMEIYVARRCHMETSINCLTSILKDNIDFEGVSVPPILVYLEVSMQPSALNQPH